MKGLVTVGLLAGLLAFAAPKQADAQVHVSVGVGFPGFGAIVTTGPAYVPYPYPVYHYAPPVVYVPAPVYGPFFHHRKHWRNHAYYRPVGGHRHHRHCHH